MRITSEEHGTTLLLKLSGELTADSIESFMRTGRELVENKSVDVVIDFKELTLIDSTGLESLLELQDEINAGGGRCKLTMLNDLVQTVFKVTRLDRAFDMHDSVEAAARSLY